MKRIQISIVGPIASVLCLALFFGTSNAEDKQPVLKVGGTFALTGNLAAVGAAEQNGLILGFEEASKRFAIEVELLSEDNGGDPKTAVNTAHKLLDINKVDLFISAFTHITQALKNIVAAHNVPMIYISTVKTIAAENPLFFRDYYEVASAGHLLAEAASKKGFKKLAYIGDEGESCKTYYDALASTAKARDLNFVLVDEFMSGTADLKPVLLKARSRKPDAIVFCSWRDMPAVMNGMQQLGMLGIPALHIEAAAFPSGNTPEMKKLYERNQTISSGYGFAEGNISPNLKDLSHKYESRFGETFGPDALFAYDLAFAITESSAPCIKEAFDVQCFAQKMTSLSFQGAESPFSFAKDRNSVRRAFLMKHINGKWQELGLDAL